MGGREKNTYLIHISLSRLGKAAHSEMKSANLNRVKYYAEQGDFFGSVHYYIFCFF